MFHIFMFVAVLAFIAWLKGLDPRVMPDGKTPATIVYKESNGIQCETAGLSLAESAQILIDQGIKVGRSRCAMKKDEVRITLCGNTTGIINLHKIEAKDLPKAEQLLYVNVATLSTEEGEAGYQLVDCLPGNDIESTHTSGDL